MNTEKSKVPCVAEQYVVLRRQYLKRRIKIFKYGGFGTMGAAVLLAGIFFKLPSEVVVVVGAAARQSFIRFVNPFVQAVWGDDIEAWKKEFRSFNSTQAAMVRLAIETLCNGDKEDFWRCAKWMGMNIMEFPERSLVLDILYYGISMTGCQEFQEHENHYAYSE